jgi:hypothetical protein
VVIPKGFHAATCPSTVTGSFKSVGISLIIDKDRIIRFQVTPHTSRGVIEKSALKAELIEIREEEDGEDANFDPNDQEYLARCAEIL